MGKTRNDVLAALRREQPARLSALMPHLAHIKKDTVQSILQRLRRTGYVRVEDDGRHSTWSIIERPEVVQQDRKYRGKLSDWTQSRLEKKTVEGEGDCLIWQGHVASSGAPVVYRGGQRLYLRLLIWRELHGEEPAKNMVAASSCRTHGCCNPRHVVLMSRSERQSQAVAEGRRPGGAPWSTKMALVQQSRSKIDWEMVRRIRACSSLMEAVRMSGLPKGNVAQIWMRKTWRNDPQDIWASVFMRLAA